MLSEADQELLCAAVDGELSGLERRRARDLLRHSAEARNYFASLKQDSEELQALPLMPPAEDFASSIVAKIAERGLTPVPLPPLALRRTGTWALLAAGVACFLIVVMGSYIVFSTAPSKPKNGRLADSEPTIQVERPAVEPLPKMPVAKVETDPPSVDVGADDPEALTVMPRVLPEDYFTSPPIEAPELFDVEKVRLSLLMGLNELNEPYPRQRLRKEIGRDKFIRLDLFCHDEPKALDALQRGLKGQGLSVLTDPAAIKIARQKSPGELAFFSESLTPEQVVDALEKLAEDDRKRGNSLLFDRFVLSPFVPADRSRMARLLGVAPQSLVPTAHLGKIDPRKPLEDQTGSQIADTLGKRNEGAGALQCVVVPYASPTFSPAKSAEVKAFLDQRGAFRSGACPMMLVLRVVPRS